MRGGRSLVDRANPVTVRCCDIVGSVMGWSGMNAQRVDGAIDTGPGG